MPDERLGRHHITHRQARTTRAEYPHPDPHLTRCTHQRPRRARARNWCAYFSGSFRARMADRRSSRLTAPSPLRSSESKKLRPACHG